MTMNQRVSPTLIGAFVLGAVLLGVTAVVLIGSGRLFRRTVPFVLYFPGSVNGLRVGAPVKFRGVEVGAVEDIRIRLEPDANIVRIPVIVGIDPEKIASLGGNETIVNSPVEYQKAIDAGLRGQLQTESILTGVLFVALDYFPGSPAKFVQRPHSRGAEYREIPAEASSTEKARLAVTEVLTKLAASDIEGLVDSARQTLAGLNRLVGSPDVKKAIGSLDDVTGRLGDAAGNVSHLAVGLDSNLSNLAGDFRHTSGKANAMLDQAGKALAHTDATLNDSPLTYELTRTLEEVSAAARSVRLLAGYLERNPSSLLVGRPIAREK